MLPGFDTPPSAALNPRVESVALLAAGPRIAQEVRPDQCEERASDHHSDGERERREQVERHLPFTGAFRAGLTSGR